MRFRLRTLLILLALGPPVLAGVWWFGNAFWSLLPLAIIVGVPWIIIFVLPELVPVIRRLRKD